MNETTYGPPAETQSESDLEVCRRMVARQAEAFQAANRLDLDAVKERWEAVCRDRGAFRTPEAQHLARVTVPSLLAEVERLRAELDDLRTGPNLEPVLALDNEALVLENERLRAALENITELPAYAILDEAGMLMAEIARTALE